MEAYTSFAQVYDLFMDNVPYEKWCDFIHEILQEQGINENIVLDLACGTGKMTRLLEEKGYDMIGVDNSAEMLEIARAQEEGCCIEIGEDEDPDTEEEQESMPAEEENGCDSEEGSEKESASNPDEDSKEETTCDPDENSDEQTTCDSDEDSDEETARYLQDLGMEEEYYDHAYEGPGSSILYLCQDMRELELYGTIGACVCCCNSLNYILEESDLRQVFSLVNNYLFPGGLFIFDVNSSYKYETLLADHTIAETRPEGSFIWDNYYDQETCMNEYDLTLFIREDLLTDEEEYDEQEDDEDGCRVSEKTQLPYYRFQETHFQRCYTLNTIRRLLTEAGMEFITAYDNYTRKPANEESEILTIVAREKGKMKAAE